MNLDPRKLRAPTTTILLDGVPFDLQSWRCLCLLACFCDGHKRDETELKLISYTDSVCACACVCVSV